MIPHLPDSSIMFQPPLQSFKEDRRHCSALPGCHSPRDANLPELGWQDNAALCCFFPLAFNPEEQIQSTPTTYDENTSDTPRASVAEYSSPDHLPLLHLLNTLSGHPLTSIPIPPLPRRCSRCHSTRALLLTLSSRLLISTMPG